MKLEVGMYVRTIDNGIGKIEDIINTTVVVEISDGVTTYQIKHIRDYNFKISHNIIDLIEVGDYVNGQYVVQIGKDTGWVFTEPTYYDDKSCEERHYCYNNREIKSIVTKEVFESMSYKVGD